MATIEQVRAAERARNQAHEALRAYTDRTSGAPDRCLYRQLVAELRTATENYIKVFLELNSKESYILQRRV
jgi:hypothetical protein